MTNSVEDQVTAWRTTYGAEDLCVAHVVCDSHDPAAAAFSFVAPDLVVRDLTFGELADLSRRCATVLAEQGVRRGDRVGVLMGKRVELVVAILAIWRLGAVHVPLFTAFAPAAVQSRLAASNARILVTEPAQLSKADGMDVATIIAGPEWDAALEAADPHADAEVVGGDGEVIRIFTSGTTGQPKAVSVPAKAFASFASYMHYGLDVTTDDIYWNAADPGWAYGLYYAIVGPMVIGRRSILLNAGFSPELTSDVLKHLGVTNFAAAPTVYRSLANAGTTEGVKLRVASSAGERLTADVITWSEPALGVEVRDHFGQTEHGMVVVNAWHPDVARPIRAGSMGLALPGFSAAIVDDKLALDVLNSPLMWFGGYVDAPDATPPRLSADGRWYFTGDLGSIDDDGYISFTSRDDDIILMAGYRIGPADLEGVLITHEAVSEVAVVGRPDQVRGEVVEAFVVLADGAQVSELLVKQLQDMVRTNYSAHAYPRRVHFVEALPKTPSGKIQRHVLRQAAPLP